jgi:hypothetical protein
LRSLSPAAAAPATLSVIDQMRLPYMQKSEPLFASGRQCGDHRSDEARSDPFPCRCAPHAPNERPIASGVESGAAQLDCDAGPALSNDVVP